MMLLLRFGPRGAESDEDDEEDDSVHEDEKLDAFDGKGEPISPTLLPATVRIQAPTAIETTQLLPGQQVTRVASMKSFTSASLRNSGGRERKKTRKTAANLGSIV
mmetsp:Transcript_19970/g.46648  ORF Transcript_19970/g.46648 Transcript_19970/m.46648 type:complete len:105 (-) Transcript_19970:557-871(-)